MKKYELIEFENEIAKLKYPGIMFPKNLKILSYNGGEGGIRTHE